MNLDFYLKKKHIFKNRINTEIRTSTLTQSKNKHIYTAKKCRIDFVFIRLFKKYFRRKFIKAKLRFFKPKYWLLLIPNYILTQKSKNARMGAGVGKLIRLTMIIKPGKSFIKTWYYSVRFLRAVLKFFKLKIPNEFLIR